VPAVSDGLTIDTTRFRARTRRIAKALPEIEAKAMWAASKPVWEKSQYRVPVDTGKLKGSGRRVVYRKGTSVTAHMSYGYAGSGAERYAYPIHEHPINTEASPGTWFRDGVPIDPLNYTTPGTGPKFLEGPVLESKGTFAAEVGQYIKTALKAMA
jgi:hypothetical protein